AAQGELSHGSPSFLPDGRHFLYQVISGRPELGGIYLTALGSSSRRLLLKVRSNAMFVQPGYLLFVRDGELLAQRFDTDRLSFVGEPLRLARLVESNPLTGIGAFTASDTGVLAYRTVADTDLIWYDRAGTRLGRIDVQGRVTEPALSPDGARV